jgi:hypothetical protein
VIVDFRFRIADCDSPPGRCRPRAHVHRGDAEDAENVAESVHHEGRQARQEPSPPVSTNALGRFPGEPRGVARAELDKPSRLGANNGPTARQSVSQPLVRRGPVVGAPYRKGQVPREPLWPFVIFVDERVWRSFQVTAESPESNDD